MPSLKTGKVKYTTMLLRFKDKGEKSGWTYAEVPPDVAQRLNSGVKISYRVKGKIDDYTIERVSLLPMGDGSFIIPLNGTLRKAIGKREGATVELTLEVDKRENLLNADLLVCLEEEPLALERFMKLTASHRNYFSKWIDTAKTDATRAGRIARTIDAMMRELNFAEMLREGRKKS